MSYSAIGIKFPLATYESIKSILPEATVYRTLSSLTKGSFIEIYYVLDAEIFSDKQKRWFGNIKTVISRKLSVFDFEVVDFDNDISVRALSGEIYTLKSLSDIWKKVSFKTKKKSSLLDRLKDSELIGDEFTDDIIRIPQLIPFFESGKQHENLYKTLCVYAKRLHYEKLFIYEYLELAANIYAKSLELLPKEVSKITSKAWIFIEEQKELYPEDFKQKLEPEELRAVKLEHGKRLQKYNETKRASNVDLVKDAVNSGMHYKSDGITLNKSSIAKAVGITRVTVSKVLQSM